MFDDFGPDLSELLDRDRGTAVLNPNSVPRVQKCSERSGRSERAERCSEHSRTCWLLAEGYVAKISMLRLNIGSGSAHAFRLTSSVQGGPPPPPWGDEVRLSLSMHQMSLSMHEPMLIQSMLILATYPAAALDVTIRKQRQN